MKQTPALLHTFTNNTQFWTVLPFVNLFLWSLFSTHFFNSKTTIHPPLLMEICGNDLDDDSDGLTDCDDPDCYFTEIDCECHVTDVIWTVDFNVLRWHNVNTGAGQIIGNTVIVGLSDLAWAPDGTLYAVNLSGSLFEVNHNTGEATNIGSPGWSSPNSLVTDSDGNIIVAETAAPFRVIRYDPVTGNQEIILNSTLPYDASGDLAYSNGHLYLLVDGPQILDIDESMGTFQNIPISGIAGSPWGLANNAGGELFLSYQNDFYTLDPITGFASFLSTATPGNSFMRGLSMLGDFCPSVPVFQPSAIGDTLLCQGDLGSIEISLTHNIAGLEYNWEAVPTGFPFGFGDFVGIDSSTFFMFTIDNLPPGDYQITVTDGISFDNWEVLTATIVQGQAPDTTLLTDTSCENDSTGIFTEIFTNLIGCDSVVITEITWTPPDTTWFFETSCNSLDTGIVITQFTNQYDCDSLEITITTLLPSDTFFINQSSCNPSDTGIVINTFTNQFGCDSLEIITTAWNPLDTAFFFVISCNPSDTGITINNFVSQFGCDSVEIIMTNWQALDTTFLFQTSCNTLDTGLVINQLVTQDGCDSVVVLNTSLLLTDTVYFNQSSCVIADTGINVQLLVNQFGCDSVVITQTDYLPFTADFSQNPITCFGFEDASILVENVIGGLPPFLYAINQGIFQADPLFENLASGSYSILVQDAEGCTTTLEIFVTEPPALQLELGDDLEIQLGDSIRLQPMINVPSVSDFMWSPTEFLSDTNSLNPFASPTFTSTYDLTIFTGECQTSDQLTITVTNPRKVFIPNVFSPNGDGFNDVFTIYTDNGVQVIRAFKIFDRWGELVFENTNFQPNDEREGWNGNFRGEVMTPAVFVYFAEIEYADGVVEIWKGDVVLVK